MNIALIGYGKMGKTIEEEAIKRGHTIVCKISSQNLQDFNPRVLQWADVAIEFSTPEAAPMNVSQCISLGLPVICGTTGWTSKMEEIQKKCIEANSAFLHASNFSIGVNIFFEVNRRLAQLMNKYEAYDVDIKEIHHTAKIDKPSGTAITIAKDIISQLNRKKVWTITKPDDQPSRSLFIKSERIDPAPGTHVVTYSSSIDDIQISHTAHNRTGFALGSIMAAEWIIGRKGVYSMADVLSIS